MSVKHNVGMCNSFLYVASDKMAVLPPPRQAGFVGSICHSRSIFLISLQLSSPSPKNMPPPRSEPGPGSPRPHSKLFDL